MSTTSREYLANELDAKVCSSSFMSVDEARDFAKWYMRTTVGLTDWDQFRKSQADELIRRDDELKGMT